jgi:hypothetical protein
VLSVLLPLAVAGAGAALGLLWVEMLTRYCPPDPPPEPPEPEDPRWLRLASSADRGDEDYAALRGRAR